MFNFNKIGVLGINARNLSYIRPYNSRKAVRLADNKLRTKQFLSARDIPVPKLYHVIKDRKEIDKFDFNVLPDKFVLKPNFGYGGEGIVVIHGRKEKRGVSGFVTASGKFLDLDDLRDHIGDIIDGRFSLSNQRDTAFFEQLIECDESIAEFAHKGLPDIRIVVYNLVPVMAMLRLPTIDSDGKANLHLGAAGVGIDIATGRATHILYRNEIVEEVPGKGDIRNLKIPHFEEMLLIASKIQLTTNLGYLAVDLVLDKNVGPVLLEMNARAGLAVQIANLAPLRRRLEKIKGVKVLNPEKGVRVAQDMFGNKLHKEIKHLSGKEVIGAEELVDLFSPSGGTSKVKAQINTSLEHTLIDKSYAELFKNDDDEGVSGDVEKVRIKFGISNRRIQTLAHVQDLSTKEHKMVIGRKDVMHHFLVDPAKTQQTAKLPDAELKEGAEKPSSFSPSKINFKEVDSCVNELDSKVKLLYHLKPLNLEEEKVKFFESTKYNPQFTYADLKFDPYTFKTDLRKIHVDDSQYGKVFAAKIDELERKLALLEARGTEAFTEKSIALYGYPTDELIEDASREITDALRTMEDRQQTCLDDEENGTMTADEAAKEFDKVFKKYKIAWKAKVKESMVARCIAGKKNSLFVRKDAHFSRSRLKALVAHEIETHILSAENGKRQPYKIFNRGLADYLETQEGLAIYNTNFVLKDDETFINMTPQAIAVATIVAKKGSFRDIYNAMRDIKFSKEKAFRIALKLKRGLEDTSAPGCFTKDYIYYKGFRDIQAYVEGGGKITDLYIGKLNVRDVEMALKLPGIKKPKYLPKWLDE